MLSLMWDRLHSLKHFCIETCLCAGGVPVRHLSHRAATRVTSVYIRTCQKTHGDVMCHVLASVEVVSASDTLSFSAAAMASWYTEYFCESRSNVS